MAEVVRKKRWVPIVLGLSLALNLAVVAAVSGAVLRHRGDAAEGPRARKGGAIYIQALPREMRHDMHEALRNGNRRDGAGPIEMVGILRIEPFNAEAAALVFDAQRDASVARLHATSAAWLNEVTSMSVEERSVYADRLEELTERREKRRREHQPRKR